MFKHRAVGYLMLALVAIAGGVLLMTQTASSQTSGQPEEFTATAIDVNTGAVGTVEISINRWSTPAEQRALTAALKKGTGAFLDTLQHIRPVGRVHTPDSIGYELRFAQEAREAEGVRHIGIATDRPISFWELHNRPRTLDYPFTFIELHMRPDGKGEGKLSIAAKISAKGDVIEIENYTLQPVRLENVQSRKPS